MKNLSTWRGSSEVYFVMHASSIGVLDRQIISGECNQAP